MTTSAEIHEIAAALAKARGAFKTFSKDKTATVSSKKGEGSSYSYKYGDLAALFDATTEALTANGLAIVQSPSVSADGEPVLVTYLTHASGQYFRAEFPLHAHQTPQEVGSEVTYIRRYMAGSMVGIQAEVDDDGAAAQESRSASAASAGPLRVVAVKNQPTGTGRARWRVSLSDGRVATTFSEQMSTLASQFEQEGAEVDASVVGGTYGLDLKGLKRATPTAAPPEPPAINSADIPF